MDIERLKEIISSILWLTSSQIFLRFKISCSIRWVVCLSHRHNWHRRQTGAIAEHHSNERNVEPSVKLKKLSKIDARVSASWVKATGMLTHRNEETDTKLDERRSGSREWRRKRANERWLQFTNLLHINKIEFRWQWCWVVTRTIRIQIHLLHCRRWSIFHFGEGESDRVWDMEQTSDDDVQFYALLLL